MVFSSVIFLLLFLPAVLILYFLAEKIDSMRLKNGILVFFSLVFYAWGGVQYLVVLLVLIVINYWVGIFIEKSRNKKLFLVIGLSIDIINLIIFKYSNFILNSLESIICTWQDDFTFGVPDIALPIGISFFTFQIMSYLIDVYRCDVTAQKNIVHLTLYIMMFPQLIAGPIVRYSTVNKEIEYRKSIVPEIERGMRRFIIGLIKKVFIANQMGIMADAIYSITDSVNSLYAWLGALCYTLQIFFDFSAYSDMAIGLGLIFGFHFNENFNYPYISTSVKEFWRRWHISLSTWFRDYVYIPLGGSRKGAARTYLNLSIVFFLTGIWHGAAWQFIVWGLFHGAFMLIERVGFGKLLKKLPTWFGYLYTMLIVVVGWVFFRADSLSQAFIYIGNMFSFKYDNLANPNVIPLFTNMFLASLLFGLVASTPICKKIEHIILGENEFFKNAGCLLLLAITIIYLSGLSYNPFIYFRF